MTISDRNNLILALGGLRAYEKFTEDNFIITPENKAAFEKVKSWDYRIGNLYIYGPTGCGKSHLQSMAIRDKIKNPWEGGINKINTICRKIRSAQSAADEIMIIGELQRMNILGIDDLGVEKYTEFAIGLIYDIIDYRYMNQSGGMVITSNLSLSELSEKLADDRIPSRLSEMCKIISMRDCRDWRINDHK